MDLTNDKCYKEKQRCEEGQGAASQSRARVSKLCDVGDCHRREPSTGLDFVVTHNAAWMDVFMQSC